MAQKQGNNSATEGRLGGELGTVITSANIALGAGWGSTATVSAVDAGANDQRGNFTITAGGSGLAQNTATVTLTFVDGAYAATPYAVVVLAVSSNAANEPQPTAQACSTTQLSFKAGALPVAAATYKYSYIVVA